LVLTAVAVVFSATGCGKYGHITGKVMTAGGKTVKGGNVTFYVTEGQTKQVSGSAPISEEGTYDMRKVPVGAVIICVETDSAKPPPQQGMVQTPGASAKGEDASANQSATQNKKKAENYVPIDRKCSDPATTDLSYTVTSGHQEYTITVPDAPNQPSGRGNQ